MKPRSHDKSINPTGERPENSDLPHIITPRTRRQRRRRSAGRTPARYRFRLECHELRTRFQVPEALVWSDRRCDRGAGVCGRRVGGCEAGGEGAGRGDDFEGLQGQGEGEDAVGLD